MDNWFKLGVDHKAYSWFDKLLANDFVNDWKEKYMDLGHVNCMTSLGSQI